MVKLLASDSLGSWIEGEGSGVLENSKGAGIRILLSASSEGMRLSGKGRLLGGKRGDGGALWTLLVDDSDGFLRLVYPLLSTIQLNLVKPV